jgi:hypothetical protein
MRVGDVALRVEKLPTERASKKQDEKGKGKDITAELWIIDPLSAFSAVMSSETGQQMHTGLAEFVDGPSEFYQSHAWASSVRTISGQYAYLHRPESSDNGGEERLVATGVIFPGDFILYRCAKQPCSCHSADSNDPSMAHIGRIYGVGNDHRTSHCTT